MSMSLHHREVDFEVKNILIDLVRQLRVAEFPKLALKHGILLNLPI